MKSRKLLPLPDIRPIAANVSTSMDEMVDGLVPAAAWETRPEVMIRPGRHYLPALSATFIPQSLHGFTVRCQITADGTDEAYVVAYGIRAGRAGEPFTIATAVKPTGLGFVGGQDVPTGLAVLDLEIVTQDTVRLLALPGAPVVLTLWEAPTGRAQFV